LTRTGTPGFDDRAIFDFVFQWLSVLTTPLVMGRLKA
jgi:hypothetical protein